MQTQHNIQKHTASVILTRWALLIAISYAVVFSATTPPPFWPQQVFIAAILGSNLALMWILARGRRWHMVSGWATALDIGAVTMAIAVAGDVSVEFYLIYFSILIVAAVVSDRRVLILMALAACSAYAVLMWSDRGADFLRSPDVLVRLPVLFGVALYFGTAVQLARREQEEQAERLHIEREKALAALTEMGTVALSGGYPGPVLYEIAGWIQQIVNFDRCSVVVFDEGGQRGYLAASGDDRSIEVMALDLEGYPELGPVFQRGEYTEIHPGTPPELWREVRARLPQDSPFNSFIVVPIKHSNETIGALYMRDSDPARTLSEAQVAFCSHAAQMAAAFIHEHDLLATLESRSQRDALTGFMNYPEFLGEAESHINGAAGYGPVSMAVVNIDGLGDVNKEFGHEVGTDLIAHVGGTLVQNVESEAVCRYAGGEFVLVIRGTAVDSRAMLQTRFLENLSTSAPDLPTVPRASIGIAASPGDGDNPELLFEAAHAALADARRAGGNRINLHNGG